MDILKLEEFFNTTSWPKYRFKQLKAAVFSGSAENFSSILVLPEEIRLKLSEKFKYLSLEEIKILTSSDRRAFKAKLKTKDGFLLETAFIAPKEGEWSACISCQIGCPLGCEFCATGKMGFKRNLSFEEILDQVLFWRIFLKKNKLIGEFSHLVFMGMGEPFLNWENIKKSLEILLNKDYFGFSSRKISISTAGIEGGILLLAKTFPQINLAFSLHFADDEKRNLYMPINKSQNLVKIKKALDSYFEITSREVFIEYALIDEVNDQKIDAEKLTDWIKSFGKKAYLLHINLIPYNNIRDLKFKTSGKEKAQKFKNFLLKSGVSVSIRKSLGADIAGACGQLAGES